ncbi:MAG: hypothetical protein WD045_06960 [Pirellulaceae bacterium]
MSIDGVIRNGTVVPDQPLSLPEGTRVRIEIAESEKPQAAEQRQGGWWQGQVQIAPDFDDLPDDIAGAFGVNEQ